MTDTITSPTLAARFASAFLGATGALWFMVALAGQVAFAIYVILNYGGAAAAGDFDRWNETLVGGYVPGGTLGNIVLASHLLVAAAITIGGPLQLIAALRRTAPRFHRWNGRFYIALALIASLGGLYAVWTRGTAGGDLMRVGISLNGVLIVVAAALTLRTAMSRQFDSHRRWAMRLFILVSGVWFFRIGFMAWVLAMGGPVGVGEDFDGPFVRFWAFGCYLLPLALLELYLRSRTASTPVQLATGGVMSLAIMGVLLGVFGAVAGMWLPRL